MAANFGSQRQTGCHIEGESIVAGNGLLKLSFRRTVRVPDDAKTALMPGDMGTFPLYSKSDIRSRASRPYTSADFFFPMYDDEAMFIHFQSKHRFAIRIFLGGLNVITGTRRSGRKYRMPDQNSEQDYIVTPLQKWVDGVAAGNGQVTQFFATKPDTESYSVAVPMKGMKQQTRLEFVIIPGCNVDNWPVSALPPSEFNIEIQTLTGKRIALYVKSTDTVDRLKEEIQAREGIPPDQQRLIFASRQLDDHDTMVDVQAQEVIDEHQKYKILRGGGESYSSVYDMALSNSGKIRQRTFKDTYPAGSWNDQKAAIFTVQILNSAKSYELTEFSPPTKPMDPSNYPRLGYMYFDEIDDSANPEIDVVDDKLIDFRKSKIKKLESKSAERTFDQYKAMSEQLKGTDSNYTRADGGFQDSGAKGVRSLFSNIKKRFTS